MRYAGEVNFQFVGNQELARQYVGRARVLLGELQAYTQGGMAADAVRHRSVTMQDGTVIQVVFYPWGSQARITAPHVVLAAAGVREDLSLTGSQCGIQDPAILDANGGVSSAGTEFDPVGPATSTGIHVDNGYIRVAAFGWGHGGFGYDDPGDEWANVGSLSLGGGAIYGYDDMKFDPTGSGNYTSGDYLTPGSPSEVFLVADATDTIDVYWGSCLSCGGWQWWEQPMESEGCPSWHNNCPFPHPDPYDITVPRIRTWRKSPTRVAGLRRMDAYGRSGWLLVEYEALRDKPVLAMRHSIVFDQPVGDLLIGRGIDPDPDVEEHNTYDTRQQRGLGSIPPSQIVQSYGVVTGAPLALYAPGTGYTVNTGINADWHSFLATVNGTDDGDGDYSIDVAWSIGPVPAGKVTTVCAYYVFGLNDADVLEALGQN